ncbi:MAG: YesL family protein [Chloroflexota bacterium]
MNRRLFELDPIALLFYSMAGLYRDLPVWLRLNLLGLLFTLPIVTAGAASSGVYFAVRAWVLDQIDGAYTIQQAFFEGFRQHFWRGTAVGLLNLLCGAVILFATWFWFTSSIALLNYVAVVGIYALLWWLACQPYIYPVCVASKELAPLRVLQLAFQLVGKSPVYTLLLLLLLVGINIVAIVLLGPVLLILQVFIAILTTQALWIVTDEPLPRLRDSEST